MLPLATGFMINSRLLVILANRGVPLDKNGCVPGLGSAYEMYYRIAIMTVPEKTLHNAIGREKEPIH